MGNPVIDLKIDAANKEPLVWLDAERFRSTLPSGPFRVAGPAAPPGTRGRAEEMGSTQADGPRAVGDHSKTAASCDPAGTPFGVYSRTAH